MNFSRREDDVYLDVSDGLETTKVPRVLIAGVIRRYPEILKGSMTNDVVVFDLLYIVDDLSEFCSRCFRQSCFLYPNDRRLVSTLRVWEGPQERDRVRYRIWGEASE